MIALALALALSAAPPEAPSAPGAPPGSALARITLQAATTALEDVSVGKLVGVYVEAPTPELAQAAQSLLIDSLQHKGAKAALPLAAPSGSAAEALARQEGYDVLVRVRVGLEGTDLTLAGDRIGTWVNFWDGRTEVRQLHSAALAARAPADASALTLARVVVPTPGPVQPPIQPMAPLKLGVDPLARLPVRVLALALIDVDGDGRPELAALTPTEVLLLRPDGEVLARRDHSAQPESAHPSRDPSGGLVAPDGPTGHRLLYAYSGHARGEQLSVDKGGLHAVLLLDGTPLSAGAAGLVVGTAEPGTNVYGPEVKVAGSVRNLPRAVVGLRAAPGPGEPALLALYPDGQAQPLSAGLVEVGAPLPNVGEAVLADLDGDGIPEVVATTSAPAGPSDQVRVLKVGQAQPLFQSEPLPGAILAGCAGDLDGDGKAEAILAALSPDGSTTLYRVGVKP